MKSENLTPFAFEKHSVRTITIDGEIWFVAQEVMNALEYAQASNPARVMAHIPEEWIKVNPIHSNRGRPALLISEHGLYFFLGRSDKPKALPFQKWLAGEVLPSIRKTGSYSVAPEQQLSDSDMTNLRTLCTQMQFLAGWWYQYDSAVGKFNKQIAASVHDHFIDGVVVAGILERKHQLQTVSTEYVRNYPFHEDYHSRNQYFLAHSRT